MTRFLIPAQAVASPIQPTTLTYVKLRGLGHLNIPVGETGDPCMEQNRDSVSGAIPGDLICALLLGAFGKTTSPTTSIMKQSHAAYDILFVLLYLKASYHIPTHYTPS